MILTIFCIFVKPYKKRLQRYTSESVSQPRVIKPNEHTTPNLKNVLFPHNLFAY